MLRMGPKLLDTHLSIQHHKKVKLSGRDILSLAVKGLSKQHFDVYNKHQTFISLDFKTYGCIISVASANSLGSHEANCTINGRSSKNKIFFKSLKESV